MKNGKLQESHLEISRRFRGDSRSRRTRCRTGTHRYTCVHFRDPGFTYKEDIHTGAKASAKGGFTTVICMANTSPTVDNTDTLKDNLARASKEDIRIFQAAAISRSLKGRDEVDMLALKPGHADLR